MLLSYSELFLQTLIAAIALGCVYGILSASLSLIFGIMKIMNFAQGEFMMLGMYTGLFLTAILVSVLPINNFYGAILVTLPTLALFYLLGYLLYQYLIIRPSGADVTAPSVHAVQAQLILTLGISLILQNGALMLFGSEPKSITTNLTSEAWHIGPFFDGNFLLFLNKGRTLIALMMVSALLVMYVLLNNTVLGKRLRGASDNPLAATYVGIRVSKQYAIAFGIGTAFTAAAGVMIGTYYPFQPYVGLEFVIVMYAGVVLGGMGSLIGAFLGGVIIGVIQQMSTLLIPVQLQNSLVFAMFLFIIMVLPNGLFGKNVERV